jgi:imidazolonepropionase-like amidohydrolase
LANRLLALTGGTILDGTGSPPIPSGIIVINGERVATVGSSSVAVPLEAYQIDVTGKYIIPGLMDANVHLLIDTRLENLIRYEGRYEELITEAAQIALRNGLTTVFDTWGPRKPLMRVRDSWEHSRTRRADLT